MDPALGALEGDVDSETPPRGDDEAKRPDRRGGVGVAGEADADRQVARRPSPLPLRRDWWTRPTFRTPAIPAVRAGRAVQSRRRTVVPGELEGDVRGPSLVSHSSAGCLAEDVVVDLPVGAPEGVEPLGADGAVEDEGDGRPENRRLPRAILAEQEEPAMGDDDLLVVEVPVVDQDEPAQDVARVSCGKAIEALGHGVESTEWPLEVVVGEVEEVVFGVVSCVGVVRDQGLTHPSSLISSSCSPLGWAGRSESSDSSLAYSAE